MIMCLQHLLGGCIIFSGKTDKCLLGIVVGIFFVLTMKVSAAEVLPELELFLKPSLCVLSETETECSDQVVAEWKSSVVISVCLYKEQQEEPLECWHNTAMGRLEFSSSLSHTTFFELRDVATKKIIANTIYQVISTRKKYHIKRRNPWSFF